MSDNSKMKQYSEDAIVLREGQLNKVMYKIISGQAAVYINYGKENEYLVGVLSDQKCFGELGILCQCPSMYTIVAITDLLVSVIAEEEFDEFLRSNFYNVTNIIQSLAKEVRSLKCNLDMVITELESNSAMESYKVNELKQKVYKNFAADTNQLMFYKKL